MRTLVVLLLAGAAWANPESDRVAFQCMREYYATLPSPGASLDSVRDRLIIHMKTMSPKTGASVRRQLNKGFKKKYKKDDAYLRCLAQLLAAGGPQGIATLYRTYKSDKRVELRKIIAEELSNCGDLAAVGTLAKVMYDKDPEVAATAIRGLGGYKRIKPDARKSLFKKLVEHYTKVTNKAAGKDRDSTPMKMFLATRPAFNATLKALSGGEELDSAEAWSAWMRENITKPWPE